MREYPQFNMVGEEWSLNPLITSYWQKGKNNTNGFQDCLKTVMDFPMQDALVKALTEKDVPYTGKGFTRLYEGLANDIAYPDPQHLLVLGDNHDMDRLMTQLNGDWNLTQMAIGYLLTTRGIPQIMYGTEIGMENIEHPGHHGYIRSDFPGGWKSDTVNAFTGRGLSNQQKNLQQYVQQLLQWRKQHPVIANGKTLHFAPFDDVYVYFRYNAKDTVMVVINKDHQPKTFSLARLEEMLRGKQSAFHVITKEKVVLDKELTVPPTSTSIFEIR
jgi:neopullulanase